MFLFDIVFCTCRSAGKAANSTWMGLRTCSADLIFPDCQSLVFPLVATAVACKISKIVAAADRHVSAAVALHALAEDFSSV